MNTVAYCPRFLTPEMLESVSLLGISGEAGSGKSAITRELVRQFGFSPWSLANPFKFDGIMTESLPVEEVLGSRKSPRTRQWLQERGTEYGRRIAGEDVWVNYLECAIWYLLDHGVKNIVVPDVRFPNEMSAVESLGGKTYRVVGRGGAGERSAHVSERGLDGFTFDRVLDNSGTLEDTMVQVEGFLWTDFRSGPLWRKA
jgi:hypothetical protein